MTILRLARYHIQPHTLEACQQAVREIVENVRASEPGTLLYSAWQRQDDPLSLVHCSLYRDGAALERHLGNAHMLARIQGVLQPAMTAPPAFEQFTLLASTAESCGARPG